MKVEICASGNMVVRAESTLEAYALTKWKQDNNYEKLLVDVSFPVPMNVVLEIRKEKIEDQNQNKNIKRIKSLAMELHDIIANIPWGEMPEGIGSLDNLWSLIDRLKCLSDGIKLDE